jgi:hypothetical protein
MLLEKIGIPGNVCGALIVDGSIVVLKCIIKRNNPGADHELEL